MAVLKPCAALVRTESGAPYDCTVANLSGAGAFLRTSADLKFRENLQVELLGVVLQAEVLFVSREPVGVVVAFEAEEVLRERLAQSQDEVEVLVSQGIELDDPWDDDTAAGMSEVPHYDEAPVPDLPKLGASDLDALESQPVLDADPAPFDPSLMAAALFDDSSSDVAVHEVDVPKTEPETISEEFVSLADPASDLASDLAVPAPLPLELVAFAETNEETAASIELLEATLPPDEMAIVLASAPPDVAEVDAPPVTQPSSDLPLIHIESVVLEPADLSPEAVSEVELPAEALSAAEEPAAAPEVEPPPAELPAEALSAAEKPAAAPEVEPPPADLLPTLERDGFTVSFESTAAYKTQFDASLRHGGLVVSASPLSIGTQRMLALNIPGSDVYTVSARVVFAEPGKLGFMLDSFALHKSHLESLGR